MGILLSVFLGVSTPSQPIESGVLVELFTSQGCSSCPPADRILSSLREKKGVIPLAYHVDYWNYIGWRDPFSDGAWTARQHAYASRLPSSIYTPQLVIGGRKHIVGSRGQEVLQGIAEELERAQPITIRGSVGGKNRSLQLDVRTSGEYNKPWALSAVVFASRHRSKITRGEHAGETLNNDFVVFKMKQLKKEKVSHAIDLRDLKFDAVGIAVFAYDLATMEILGAGVVNRWNAIE
jgi:hypothetical protein